MFYKAIYTVNNLTYWLYYFGDVFYFKGSQIFIDQKSKHEINDNLFAKDIYRRVDRISILKYGHQLSPAEIDAADQQHREDNYKAKCDDEEYAQEMRRFWGEPEPVFKDFDALWYDFIY